MTSSTGGTDCPNCGAFAQTCLHSNTKSSNRLGVILECDEWLLGCTECGYYEDTKSELHSDGKWYTYETFLRPHRNRAPVDMQDIPPRYSGVSGIKDCPVALMKDGTMIPFDPINGELLYRKGEDGTLIPLRSDDRADQPPPNDEDSLEVSDGEA